MYNCVIFGATGAIGREFTEILSNSKKWSKIYIITRRQIPKFENLQTDKRFHFLTQQNILDLEPLKTLLKTQKVQIDGIYNFLGTRTKTGKANFIKIDKTYVIQSFQFAQYLKAKHFLHVTSKGSNANSCFLYMKTKGEVENELKKMDFGNISILKPGALLNRDNDERFGEKVLRWIPFVPKIETRKVAEFAGELVERVLEDGVSGGYKDFEHNDILNGVIKF